MNASSRDLSLWLALRGVRPYGHELGQLSAQEMTENVAQRQAAFGIMTLVQCIGLRSETIFGEYDAWTQSIKAYFMSSTERASL
jgi:hypothetical protein